MQRALLALLVGAVPASITACGDDDAPAGQAITLLGITISPTEENVDVGEDQTFEITSATVLLDPGNPDEETTLEDLSEEALAAEVEDGNIDQAQHDAIVAALRAVVWASDDEDVATVSVEEVGEDEYPPTSATATGESPGVAMITATVSMEIADPEGFEAANALAEDTGEDPILEDIVAQAELTAVSIKLGIFFSLVSSSRS